MPKKAPKKGETKEYEYVRKSFTYEGERYWVRGKTEEEAIKKKIELMKQLEKGELAKDGNMTVREWSELWLSSYVKPKVRKPGSAKKKNTMTQKSYDMYVQKLDGYILPAIKNMRLKDVKDIHLQNILNKSSDMSLSHVKKLRIVIKAMFRQAFVSRLIAFDPSISLTLPAAEEGERRSITEEERTAILKVSETNPHGLLIRFFLDTGARPGEAPPLLVSDLVLNGDDNSYVKITKSLEAGTYVVGDPKTKYSIRDVPLPYDIIPLLRNHIKDKSDGDYLFPQIGDNDKMMTANCLSKYWKNFARDVDLFMGAEATPHGHIYDLKDVDENGKPLYPDENGQPRNGHKLSPDVTLYALRHTYCTDLKIAGVPLQRARFLMGHANISTTANIYTHADISDVFESVKQINAFRKAKEAEKTE